MFNIMTLIVALLFSASLFLRFVGIYTNAEIIVISILCAGCIFLCAYLRVLKND